MCCTLLSFLYQPTDIPIPEKTKLTFKNKVPQNLKWKKSFKNLKDIRGPATAANILTEGQYGIMATTGGYLKHGHLEMIRLTFGRRVDSNKVFARWRVNAPHKPVTKKGQGQRMGGGKGNVDHYVTAVKAGRLIIEVWGKAELQEVMPVLTEIRKKLPFRSKIVSVDSLKEEEEVEKYLVENNANPWTFEKIARENYLGVSKYLGPYDYKWFGRYR
ncbi:putative 39S ribosomal protein L16, mitochondrial isoform X2 [Apostichopus japonicus]|uniref:Large ribosomal subunit protein uL16m n=1 Tax=Stichopus japonicus TaxID=307972 RepID=A0A2G8KF65_STIJA|nr:putative 39S ribosomal protein L16, mitochondrial isoform X2 [Apostichopus japonicus]